jgi:hypothetical protein
MIENEVTYRTDSHAEIARQVAEFIARGGQIEVLPSGPAPQTRQLTEKEVLSSAKPLPQVFRSRRRG